MVWQRSNHIIKFSLGNIVMFLIFAQKSYNSWKKPPCMIPKFWRIFKENFSCKIDELPFNTQLRNFHSVQLWTDVQWPHDSIIPHNNFIFYIMAARQVCMCWARPIFNCAARMCLCRDPKSLRSNCFLPCSIQGLVGNFLQVTKRSECCQNGEYVKIR